MFCPNCGKSLDDNAAFCGNCGFNLAAIEGPEEATVLTTPQVNFVKNDEPVIVAEPTAFQSEPQVEMNYAEEPAEEKPEGKKKKKTGLIVVLLLVFLGLGAIVVGAGALVAGSFVITPEATANDFAAKLASGDTQGVYQMIFGDDSVVTYEQFNNNFNNNDQFVLNSLKGSEDNYVVESNQDGEYTISDADGDSIAFKLEKTKDGFWYFDEYRVIPAVCTDFEIYVPEGTTVFLNDVKITAVPEFDKVTALNKYVVYPLLPDVYTLRAEYSAAVYEKRVSVTSDEYCNIVTIDANEITDGTTIKLAEEYTEADGEAFFNKMMNEYLYDAYKVVYYESPENLVADGIGAILLNDYRVYAGEDYNSALEKVNEDAVDGVLISDIMTVEEYNALASKPEGYAVYKVSKIQDRISSLWGNGALSVADIVKSNDVITSKGFVIVDSENAQRGNCDYYGKVESTYLDKDANHIVVTAYVLRCDSESGKVYDEGSGLQVAVGQVNRGAGVDFDAIVSKLNINTARMKSISFSFKATDSGIVYLGSSEKTVSKDVLDAQNAVVENYDHSFYMKVKADGGLNMRFEPTEESQIIKLISNNSAIEVKGYAANIKGWVYVSWGGYEGWVSYKYLIPAEYNSQPEGGEYWYVVDAGGDPLNMRNGDDTTAKRVGSIPDGSLVKFLCYNDDATWAYVIYDNKYIGWVSAEFIDFYSY